jgi:hypothetical protein
MTPIIPWKKRVAQPLVFDFLSTTQPGVPRPFDCAQSRLLRSLQGRVAMLPMGFVSKSRGVSAVPTGLGSISLALTQD